MKHYLIPGITEMVYLCVCLYMYMYICLSMCINITYV